MPKPWTLCRAEDWGTLLLALNHLLSGDKGHRIHLMTWSLDFQTALQGSLHHCLNSTPSDLRVSCSWCWHSGLEEGVLRSECKHCAVFICDVTQVAPGVPTRYNFWGYSTVGYFAPMARYSAGAPTECSGAVVINEFKGLVKAAHAAGIEVILDVVFNHSAEGNEMGPSLHFRCVACHMGCQPCPAL